MDLLKLVQKIPFAPPLFKDDFINKLGEKGVVPDVTFPKPSFASRRQDGFPQAIAHRGSTRAAAENTLRAFEDAVNAGAQGLETDTHLSKDGVVVLSHDADLKRCFGVEKKVKDCDWAFLETLRAVRAPHDPPARLADLLKLLQRPSWTNVWLLLDIKRDDDPEELMQRIAETIGQVDPAPSSAWKDRILLGYWTAPFIPLCHKYLPGFSIAHIGFAAGYSRQFVDVPGSAFNFLQGSQISPSGRSLLRAVQERQRVILSWTVNTDKGMDWCIRRQFDGVITDDVPKLLESYRTYRQENRHFWPFKILMLYVYFNMWLWLLGYFYRTRFSTSIVWQAEGKKGK